MSQLHPALVTEKTWPKCPQKKICKCGSVSRARPRMQVVDIRPISRILLLLLLLLLLLAELHFREPGPPTLKSKLSSLPSSCFFLTLFSSSGLVQNPLGPNGHKKPTFRKECTSAPSSTHEVNVSYYLTTRAAESSGPPRSQGEEGELLLLSCCRCRWKGLVDR